MEGDAMRYAMTDTKVDRPTVTRIEVMRVTDDEPDLSWLEQECWNDRQEGSTLPDEGLNWGQNRIDQFGETWGVLGIMARCLVMLPMGGASTMVPVQSPGLWGVDEDWTLTGEERGQQDAYLREIEDEQIDELRAMLDQMNVTHADVEIVR